MNKQKSDNTRRNFDFEYTPVSFDLCENAARADRFSKRAWFSDTVSVESIENGEFGLVRS